MHRAGQTLLPFLFLAMALPVEAAYLITRDVIGSGAGRPASSGTHQLTGTAGQAATGRSSDAVYALHGGFWWTEAWFSSDAVDSETGEPLVYRLDQNHPNPFNPITRIRFTLSEDGPVELLLFDIQGRKVKTLLDGEMPSGSHDVSLDAQGLAGGVYFYRLSAGRFQRVRKLTLLN